MSLLWTLISQAWNGLLRHFRCLKSSAGNSLAVEKETGSIAPLQAKLCWVTLALPELKLQPKNQGVEKPDGLIVKNSCIKSDNPHFGALIIGAQCVKNQVAGPRAQPGRFQSLLSLQLIVSDPYCLKLISRQEWISLQNCCPSLSGSSKQTWIEVWKVRPQSV